MEKLQLPYSLKNIPIPSAQQYKKVLVDKVQKFTNSMRWKWFHINNPSDKEQKKTYGFKSNKSIPPFPEMTQLKPFEDDLLELISNVKFKPVNDQFQNKLKADCKIIKDTKEIIASSDKTSNLYKVPVDEYKKHLHNNVTKDYRKCDSTKVDETNKEAAKIATKIELSDRIEKLSEQPSYVTIKDHKENFPGRIQCRLINPSKTKIGMISKSILENIISTVKRKSGVNQWKSTKDVLHWFTSLRNKPSLKFFKFDIESFYPSITKDLLVKSLEFAKKYITISQDDFDIIMHARKTFLFSDNHAWIKKNEPDFDVPMGAFDSAEISELVGLFLLHELEQFIPKENVGLYRDDGLAVTDLPGPGIDQLRKKVINMFKSHDLNITVDINIVRTDFLDVVLDLSKNTYTPYRKENFSPKYINVKSCHPPNIKKELPNLIETRLSTNSSSQQEFDTEKLIYNDALKSAGYKHNLTYTPNHNNNPNNNKRNRKRNILWFNPPWNSSVATNIAREFLKLVDKHFPVSSNLHKYFNRNNIKVSYSCMPNMQSIINSHNRKLLENHNPAQDKGCNCRQKDNCPLDGKCLTESVIYEANVQTNNEEKSYIGLTANSFKTRYYGHIHTFNNRNQNGTGLSNYIWNLKDQNKPFNIKWSIKTHAPSFKQETNRCQLCLSEKVKILDANRQSSLNKRHEIFSKCPHRRKKLLDNLVCNQ